MENLSPEERLKLMNYRKDLMNGLETEHSKLLKKGEIDILLLEEKRIKEAELCKYMDELNQETKTEVVNPGKINEASSAS